MRKTKIICTIGPASQNEEMLKKLFLAGMNVARLNFSHGSHHEHRENIARIRKVRDSLELPGAVLLDTKGPEIRIKNFEKGEVLLKEGEYFTLTTEDVIGNTKRVSVTYLNLSKELKEEDTILIDDGKVMLKVAEIDGAEIKCKIVHGGKISNHKGVNIPDVEINMPYLSQKDKDDLKFGIEEDVDYVAASFIRTSEDAGMVREFLNKNGGEKIKLIAKIESMQGIDNFEDILGVVDGIMIARGDMGVEVPYELLPGIQKRLIRRCVQQGKVVITATQMLESMITSPVPTRAEINDVANAVFDGTSAVMLSGESAAGMYPEESVKAMSRIATEAEKELKNVLKSGTVYREMDNEDTTNAVAHAACTLAKDICADAIIAVTASGYTGNKVSKFRPDVPIISVTPNEKVFHQMALFWGVSPLMVKYCSDVEEMFDICRKSAAESNLIKENGRVVLTAGVPVGVSGTTNIIRVYSKTNNII